MPATRVLSAALALLMVVSIAAPSGARALTQYGFTYTQSGGAVTVTGCDGACPTTLDIPAVLGGYFVTAIGDEAFDQASLVALTIPSTVTTIGGAAFSFNNLTSLTIPNSVTSIGGDAFFRNSLTSVTIPNSVTSIGNYAFYANDLTTVTIGNSVTSIGNWAFAENDLTTVTIPSSVTSIGAWAFSPNSLTTVTIGSSVTSIGYGAFRDNLLATVTIPNSVTSIADNAFADNALITVTIPDSVTSIGHSAFFNNLLTTVTIPNSVTSIGESAFDSNRLTSVTFLGNAPLAGNDVFLFNGGLTSVSRPYSATGWGSTWSGVPVVIADARATATVRPTIAGTATVGRTLTARGTWTGYPSPTLTYQWYACTRAVTAARTTVPSTCKKITGATRSTFKLTSAQRGKYVAVLVKGTSLRTTATTWLSKTTAKVR
jgi:BspA type Leucine rich repeat region (6 copies)